MRNRCFPFRWRRGRFVGRWRVRLYILGIVGRLREVEVISESISANNPLWHVTLCPMKRAGEIGSEQIPVHPCGFAERVVNVHAVKP